MDESITIRSITCIYKIIFISCRSITYVVGFLCGLCLTVIQRVEFLPWHYQRIQNIWRLLELEQYRFKTKCFILSIIFLHNLTVDILRILRCTLPLGAVYFQHLS